MMDDMTLGDDHLDRMDPRARRRRGRRLGLFRRRAQLHRLVAKRPDNPLHERIVRGEAVLSLQDTAYRPAGIAAAQRRDFAERVIEQHGQVVFVARVGFGIPQRADHRIGAIAFIEPHALAVDGKAFRLREFFLFIGRDIKQQAARVFV